MDAATSQRPWEDDVYDRLLARCLGIHAPSLLPLKKFPKQRLLLPIAHHIVALLRQPKSKNW